MARKKSLHVGATPQWMFAESTLGLNTRKTPRRTSRSWVAKSITASTMLSPAASFTPMMLSATSTTITTAPPTMSQGFSRSGSQKIER